MTKPTVAAWTQAVFDGLPEKDRLADEAKAAGANGWPLLRYLSLVGDQAGDVATLIDRFTFTPLEDGGPAGDTSDIIDPTTADAAWLTWIAQFVGLTLADLEGLDTPTRRTLIADPSLSWLAGSKLATRTVVATVLTGTKTVRTYDHWLGAYPDGDQWTVAVATRHTETSDPAAVLTAAERSRPAGVTYVHTWGVASWARIEVVYPTWSAVDATGSWNVLEDTL